VVAPQTGLDGIHYTVFEGIIRGKGCSPLREAFFAGGPTLFGVKLSLSL
jgi:hypothetical protein